MAQETFNGEFQEKGGATLGQIPLNSDKLFLADKVEALQPLS